MVDTAEESPSPVSASNKEATMRTDEELEEMEAAAEKKSTSKKGTAKSSSMLMSDAHKVPIIEVEMDQLTYKPISSTGAASAKRQKMKERTVVLDKISTKISPYKLTAWIGPSGSGKTSLTSVVAGLVDYSDIEGSIIVNGEEGRIPKQMVGVVWQDDLLLSNLTVEETIFFAARLKTPHKVPDSEVRALVEDVMDILGLIHIRDNLIGAALNNQRGISGGERKRTAVAAELVVRPSLLLLDEPTSGLDATTAYSLMGTLRDLASLGHAIAVVIHQPRTDIFKMLDHLLLLSKGKVVYDGPAKAARLYLENAPTVGELPPETGIADWIMDNIILDQKKGENAALAKRWREHGAEYLKVHGEHDKASDERRLTREMSTLSELKDRPTKYEAPFLKQLKLLGSRTMKQRRGEKFTKVSFFLTGFYVIFTSFGWWQIPDNTSHTFERSSILFFMLIAQGNSTVVGSINVFQRDRALLRRERAKKLYGVLPFFLAKTASDMTSNIFFPLCYGIIVYFTAGLRLEAAAFFKFVLGFYLTLNCAQSMGLFMSIIIPNMQTALILAPPITLFFFIIGGFYIPVNNMNWGIKWASYISFCRYGYGALLVNEYEGRTIPCSSSGSSISVGTTGQCPLPGESVYHSLGIDRVYANYWFNIGILVVLNFVLLTAAYFMLRRQKQ